MAAINGQLVIFQVALILQWSFEDEGRQILLQVDERSWKIEAAGIWETRFARNVAQVHRDHGTCLVPVIPRNCFLARCYVLESLLQLFAVHCTQGMLLPQYVYRED